jgi:hypothetical protein
MIVRILGEGQFEVPEAAVAELNELDGALEAAVEQRRRGIPASAGCVAGQASGGRLADRGRRPAAV